MPLPRLDRLDKNLIINGNFAIDQRNAGGQVTVNDNFISDRWFVHDVGVYHQRVLDISESSDYALEVSTTDGHNFSQKIESIMLNQTMIGKSFKFVIKAKLISGTTFVPNIRISVPTVKDDHSSSDDIVGTVPMLGGTTDGNYKEFYYIFTMTANMVNRGLMVRPGDFLGLETYVVRYKESMLHLNNGDSQEFRLAGRDVMGEVKLCRRYFEKSYDLETVSGTITNEGRIHFRGCSIISLPFQEIKRTVPIVTVYSPSSGTAGLADRGGLGEGACTVSDQSTTKCSATIPSNDIFRVHFVADAEL